MTMPAAPSGLAAAPASTTGSALPLDRDEFAALVLSDRSLQRLGAGAIDLNAAHQELAQSHAIEARAEQRLDAEGFVLALRGSQIERTPAAGLGIVEVEIARVRQMRLERRIALAVGERGT